MKLLKFILSFVLISIITTSNLRGQEDSLSVGGYAGLGSIRGNSPALTAVSGSLFLNYSPYFWNGIYFRTDLHYSRKVEYFLPEDRTNRYYPYVWGFSFKTQLYQNLNDIFFLREGIGISALNDRTYSDVDDWGVGFVGNFEGGFVFEEHNLNLGVGLELSQTFINTSINYFNFYFIIEYYL
jgi:hypothetical protein